VGITEFVLENVNGGEGQTRGKNRRSTFVLTAFNFFVRFNISMGTCAMHARCYRQATAAASTVQRLQVKNYDTNFVF
jgi:hypothetical protein